MAEDGASPGRFPRALAAGLLALAALYALAEAFGPRGFALRDESISLFLAQRWRLGTPAAIDVGGGVLLYTLQGWLFWLSGHWQLLHLPGLAAWLFQGWALSRLARRYGGEGAAQGAFLAAWLSAAALIQARSLLHFALVPSLLAAVLLLSEGPLWSVFLGGALAAAGLLEYEGVLFALPGLAAFCLWEPRLQRPQRRSLAAGFAAGAAVALFLARHSVSSLLRYRLINNNPLPGAPGGGHAWGQAIVAWLFGGDPQPYLGVWQHPSFAAWALPLAVWGLWQQGRQRPWLALWALSGLCALLPAAGPLEPQRAIAALLPLVLAAGFGWREAWTWAQARRWAALLLVTLPVLGFAWEIQAFEASMRHGQPDYERSQAWIQLNQDPQAPMVDGSLLPAGLSLEATRSAPPASGLRHVWVPVELGAELGDVPWPSLALGAKDSKSAPELLVEVPAGDPLRQDLVLLRQGWLKAPLRERPAYAEIFRQMLPRLQTRLGRAAALRCLLEQDLPIGGFQAGDLQALYALQTRSPWLLRSSLEFAPRYDLRLAWHLCWLLRRAGGDSALSEAQRALLATPYLSLPARPGAPPWPEPQAEP